MWSGRAPSRNTSPWVMQAAMAKVPASIRSGTVRCRTGSNPSTPSTSIEVVPAPETLAPISPSMWARSWISGSRAAFSITVVPRAPTAAISTFSVAPTLGKSSETNAPCRPCGATASRYPWEDENSTPIRSKPFMCRSILREPMLQPPGMATRARPNRASSGPSTTIEARICRTSS